MLNSLGKQNTTNKRPQELQKQSDEIISADEQLSFAIEKEVNEINPNLLKNLSKDKKKEVISTVSMMVMKSHSGPLPSPETFEGYERVLPGTAERIISMAEKQQDHRMKMESKHLSEQLFQSKLGQIFGLSIGIICIMTGAYLVMNGHEVPGSILFGTTLIGLVTVFVLGKKSQKD